MLRIDVPQGRQPAEYVWTSLAPHLAPEALGYSGAVYAKSKLPLRIFEAARIRVAQINGCEMCQSWRGHRDTPAMLSGYGLSEAGSNLVDADIPDESFYAAVENWRDAPDFSDRERVAIEFADRYATDPKRLRDDDFWDEVDASFTKEEVVDLMLCLGAWIAGGRLQAVLGVDDACQIGTASFASSPAGESGATPARVGLAGNAEAR